MTVHVVGNLCLDTTLSVPRFPTPGETMVALAGATGLGGKGVNQAVAAARSGAVVVLHAAIGQAEAGHVAERLSAEPRLTLHLERHDGASDTSTILVRPDGENMIVSTTGCAQAFDPAERPGWATTIAPGDLLVMQGNMRPSATVRCLSAGRQRAAMTVLNPSPLWWGDVPVWRDIDWLVVNAGELAALSGEDDPHRGAAVLLEQGVGALAVTLGRRGAFLLDRSGRIDVAAPAVETRDTSGAGDVFCGVFVAHLAQGATPGEGLARAVAAASFSVTRAGALASCPTAGDLDALATPPIHRSFR